MIKQNRQEQAPNSGQESGWRGMLSYQTLMIGMGVVFALAVFLKLNLNRPPDTAQPTISDDAAFRSAMAGNDPRLAARDEFQSQRRPVGNPAAVSDSDESGRDVRTLSALHRLNQALARAGSREQQTAAALKEFAASGTMADLRAIDRQDVVALARYLSDELSPAEAGRLLQRFLGLPAVAVQNPEDVSSTMVEIFDAVAGNSLKEVRPSVLMVTDGADADGRITGQAHQLPVGTERVYAVFENDRGLAGLDQVLAVWRNPSDDRMVFTEFEPIRQGSAYNYVWLEVESGWPEGRYQVELFHPEAQSLLLASETFSVR